MKKYIRKADIILFIALIISGLAVSVSLSMSHSEGRTVVIKSGGDLYATYSLYEDRTVVVPAPSGEGSGATKSGKHTSDHNENYNVIEIKNGEVFVSDSSCRNRVCIRRGRISRSGESIVCLPNKLVVRIDGKGGEYDSVTS